jgi:hypothetical protein
MKTLSQAVNDLEHLVESFVPRYIIPSVQGKNIRVGKTIIRRSQKLGYVIVDTKANTTVANAFSKPGAIAIAKAYNENQPYDQFEKLDQNLAKHYNDTLFYSNILENTKDELTKCVMLDRLELSQEQLDCAYTRLEKFILTVQ